MINRDAKKMKMLAGSALASVLFYGVRVRRRASRRIVGASMYSCTKGQSINSLSSEMIKIDSAAKLKKISDSPFRLDYMDYDPAAYNRKLQRKITDIRRNFGSLLDGVEAEVRTSVAKHYRLRCRFAVVEHAGRLHYAMWERGRLCVLVAQFPVASAAINSLMPKLLHQIESDPGDGSMNLRNGLRAINFLNTLNGDMVVTLIYATELDTKWKERAQCVLAVPLGIGVVGRSKGVVVYTHKDYVTEELVLLDGRRLLYKQLIDSFSNPNGHMNCKTVDWLCSIAASIRKKTDPHIQTETDCVGPDLLELYCGNGNHTCALALHFRRILAIEIDSALVKAGNENLAVNGITSARVIQAPSAKFCEGVLRKRRFVDKDDAYDFGTVLVDPPRAGLDQITLKLVQIYDAYLRVRLIRAITQRYDHILYISCNPDALFENMVKLSATHKLNRFVCLDHFPYTEHMECGAYFKKKK